MTLRALGHPGFDVAVYDGDCVAAHNPGRQRFTAMDVGANKAVVLVHRINAFHQLAWKAVPRHYVVDPNHRWGYDLFITAVDLAMFRVDLARAYANASSTVLWLDMGNGPDLGNAILGHLGRPRVGLHLPNVFDGFPELASMEAVDREAPSCSAEESLRRQEWPVNRVAAMTGAALLWDLFRHGAIQTHGAFFRLRPMSVQPLAIDPATWGFMGWTAPAR